MDAPSPFSLTHSSPLASFARALSRPPLLPGEDSASYDDLLERVARTFAPTDVVEAMWVKDIADREWDLLRALRVRAGIVRLQQQLALERLLRRAVPPGDPRYGALRELAREWLQEQPKARRTVARLLRACGLDEGDIQTQCHLEALDELDTIERQITAAELRRDRIIDQLERRTHRRDGSHHSRRPLLAKRSGPMALESEQPLSRCPMPKDA